MARQVKSLKIAKGYAHREHRSKKGRQKWGSGKFSKQALIDYKLKLEELKIWEDLKQK